MASTTLHHLHRLHVTARLHWLLALPHRHLAALLSFVHGHRGCAHSRNVFLSFLCGHCRKMCRDEASVTSSPSHQ